MNKKLTCEEFLKYFIEKATVDYKTVKLSIGQLMDVIERNKRFERNYKEFFDVIVIEDSRIVLPEIKVVSHYGGDLRNRNERMLRKRLLNLFSEATYSLYPQTSPRDNCKNFLETAAKDWPEVKNNERALNTAEKLLDELNKVTGKISTCFEHIVDTFIIPVLLRKSLRLRHDNLLKQDSCDFIIQVINLIKWKSGLKDVLKEFNVDIKDIETEEGREKLYKILL